MKHIERENFRAAENALLQASRDIEPLNRWYTWPSVKATAASLRVDITRSEATMTQQVTALTGTLNAVADHLRNHANEAAGAVVVTAQQAVGKPSRNLEVVADLLKRLVVQDFAGAKEKLNVLRQNLPERGIGAEAVSELEQVIQAEQMRFAEQLQKIVRDIGESLNKGDIARAQKTVEAAQKSSTNPNAALTAVTEFMKRLQAQDFTGAEKHLNTLRQHLPEGDIGAEVVSTLEKSVRAEQARLSELIQKAVRDIGAHINKGDIVRAQKVVEMARTSFASPNATLTAVAEFVKRVQVQDFIGAESFLPTIPKTLPDGRMLQDISEILGEAIKKERQANLTTQTSIARNVDALVQQGVTDRNLKPALQGRAMIWDGTKKDIEKAYELLPDDLRASSRDGTITMFIIRKRWNVQVGTYSISGQPGYREHMEIAVVYWPKKALAGVVTITGGNPPSTRVVQPFPGYGSSVRIKEWVEKLPKQ